ncbi:MAG TPA: polyprenyl synthetase family protein [Thermoanaerobaculia bacterium]|nr:polyprenyl synthetase family protein [Thermoanaerobaculia bacterium]
MTTYFATQRALLDEHLAAIAAEASMPDVLRPAIEAALHAPGKRIRGILTLAVGEALGARETRLLDAAAGFEMIHASSLILDDLPPLDDAQLRRGLPALHRQVGEDLAILAAVALLNHGYAAIVKNHARLSPRRWPLAELLERVFAAVGWDGTIGGEAVDLHSSAESLDFATLEYIHSRKTGALFVAAASTGAILANAAPPALRSVEAYAKNLGLAFQISDDILDVTGTAERLGKDVGKDEGKLTFVKLAGIEGARQIAGELIDTSLGAIASLGAAGAPLRDLAQIVRGRMS